MNKNKIFKLLKIAVIVFQLIFFFQIIFNYNYIIVVNPFFKNITPEYWNWYLKESGNTQYNMMIIGISYVLKWLFTLFFLLANLKILSNQENRYRIGSKKIL